MTKLKLCVLGLLILWSSEASAQSAVVAAGVNSRVNTHQAYGRGTCRTQRLTLKLIKPPQHGKVTFKTEAVVLGTVNGAGRPEREECVGKKISAHLVFYQSGKNYTGEDSFSYIRLNADNPADRSNGEITVSITVR